ncbi:MAG: hypothetical protein ACRERS_10470, partial [Methylococcales bacterium]
MIRRFAVKPIKKEKSSIVGVQAKRLKAVWNNDYLPRVIGGIQGRMPDPGGLVWMGRISNGTIVVLVLVRCFGSIVRIRLGLVEELSFRGKADS